MASGIPNKSVCRGLQSDCMPLAACVRHAHTGVNHWCQYTLRCSCRETLTTHDRQTAGVSLRRVFRRQETDGRTDARPLHTCCLLDAANGNKQGGWINCLPKTVTEISIVCAMRNLVVIFSTIKL